MRIAQVSTVSTPVRQHGSDSIETIVWQLTRELTRLGHEVTVFACAGSEVEAELVETLPGGYGAAGAPDDWRLCEWINLCRAVEQSARFDVVHSHGYLWGLPLTRLSAAAMVHTLHTTPYEDEARLRRLYCQGFVSGISHFQWSALSDLKPAAVVHHGIDPSQFTFGRQPEDYVCFLGRFIPDKGVLAAIRIARELNLRLKIAGPANDYFRDHVEPLVDGRQIEYVGYVAGTEKDRFLGGAKALLYPIEAPEPFGLVMVEAMMCGTPIAGIALGAVGEIVEEGITGCAAADLAELARCLPQVLRLDRARVRQRAEERFSAERMAAEYVHVYARAIEVLAQGEGTMPWRA